MTAFILSVLFGFSAINFLLVIKGNCVFFAIETAYFLRLTGLSLLAVGVIADIALAGRLSLYSSAICLFLYTLAYINPKLAVSCVKRSARRMLTNSTTSKNLTPLLINKQ